MQLTLFPTPFTLGYIIAQNGRFVIEQNAHLQTSLVMKLVSFVCFTHLLETQAYEHYFGNPYALRFVLTTESGGSVPAVGNCTFLEVNNRTDFIINSGG